MSIKLVNSDGDTLIEIKSIINEVKSKNKLKHHNIQVCDDNNKNTQYMDVITYARTYDINPSRLYRHLNKSGYMYDDENRKYIKSLKDKSRIL